MLATIIYLCPQLMAIDYHFLGIYKKYHFLGNWVIHARMRAVIVACIYIITIIIIIIIIYVPPAVSYADLLHDRWPKDLHRYGCAKIMLSQQDYQ